MSVHLLLQGCRCKKGCCNKRCSCFKASVKCGPGCRCANCENLLSSRSLPDEPDENKVEQEELQGDQSLTGICSELVDDVDCAKATCTSDHERDEGIPSEDDD